MSVPVGKGWPMERAAWPKLSFILCGTKIVNRIFIKKKKKLLIESLKLKIVGTLEG